MKTILRKGVVMGLFMVLLSATGSRAQQFLLQDVNGRPLRIGQYENINGSPYLRDEWTKGRVVLANGNFFEGVPLKYDLVADQLLFQTEEGQVLEFVQPVREFHFEGKDNIYRSGFAPIDNHTSASFYQVLEDGNAKLLKKSDKVIREEKAYGTATITKNIMEYTNYYIEGDDQMVRVKNEKDLLRALQGHEADLKDFIKKNKLKLKKEEDMVQLVKYYNSL